jgi:hypothetical protein
MSSAEDDHETIAETARRLLPLNAVISMSKEGDGWPSPLADAGFGLAGLEVPVRSTGALITVDAVLIRGRDDQLMLVEAKSGANLDAGQARKLDASRPEPVIRSASIQTSTAGRLPQPLAVFSCLEENSDRILQGIEGAGLDLPVISTGADVVQQRGAPFEDPALDHAFRQDIDTGRPPPVLKDVVPYADFLGKRAATWSGGASRPRCSDQRPGNPTSSRTATAPRAGTGSPYTS